MCACLSVSVRVCVYEIVCECMSVRGLKCLRSAKEFETDTVRILRFETE